MSTRYNKVQVELLGPQLHLSECQELRPEVVPAQNATWGMEKPARGTGLWTSTWSNGSSAWVAWAMQYAPRAIAETFAIVLQPKPARLVVIDSYTDLKQLVAVYGRQWPAESAYNEEMGYLDYERLAQDVDGIHLTARGQSATRLTIPSLYGWDCESTLWFRWCFFDRNEMRQL